MLVNNLKKFNCEFVIWMINFIKKWFVYNKMLFF